MPRKKPPGKSKPGPRPTPTAKLERQGSPLATKRKARGEVQPETPQQPPKPPPFMRSEAAPYWEHIAPYLHEQNLLTVVDYVALAKLCERLADYYSQREEVGDQWVVTTDYGYSKNPAASLMETTWNQVFAMMGKFGMTPTDRVNLNIKPAEKPKGEIIPAKRRFGGGTK